jgi:hypothetical protein
MERDADQGIANQADRVQSDVSTCGPDLNLLTHWQLCRRRIFNPMPAGTTSGCESCEETERAMDGQLSVFQDGATSVE